MNPDKTSIIVGPPGTGKTTALLEIVDNLLQDGFNSREICFVAFTRKAANEARNRAMDKFSMTTEDLPWFRTLHSLAFTQLGVSRNQMMGVRDYIAIAQMLGLHLTLKGLAEDGTITGLSKGDRLLFTEQMSRAQKIQLKEFWEQSPDEDIYWYELERLHNTLNEYKAKNGKHDFIDLIYMFNDDALGKVIPPIKILIVDEAQDLSTIQWDMVINLASVAEEVYIAGDDDQAIFRWAGANVDRFINCPGSRRILPQSYRVPAEIQQVANTVISRCKIRIPKTWEPRKALGVVEYVTDVSQISMDTGTWLLLARNTFLLEQYNQHCIQMGYVFESSIGSPIQNGSLEAIRSWEELRKGETLPLRLVKKIYDMMSVKVGVAYGFKAKLDRIPEDTLVTLDILRKDYGLLTDKIWHESLDRIPLEEREYFLTALKRGEKLLREPRIKVNTIHGVKGGEADNVVVITDMAQRTFNEFQQNPDDEHRVWYVACTRAKQALFIVQPQTNMCYDL